MSIDSVMSRIAALQGVAAPVAPTQTAAIRAAAPETSFAAVLQQATAGTYPHLSGDLDSNPELLGRLEALAARRGENFTVTSGGRTFAEQQRLWDGRGSNPYPVARPGTSRHESGNAADVTIGGRAIQDVIGAAELQAGGIAPLAGDAVHVELPR